MNGDDAGLACLDAVALGAFAGERDIEEQLAAEEHEEEAETDEDDGDAQRKREISRSVVQGEGEQDRLECVEFDQGDGGE
jgi:hypothetical protein